MSQTNVPNLALTPAEVNMLKAIYTHGNCVTLAELKAHTEQSGVAAKAVDSALPMLVAQGFVMREPRPRTPGGYVYSIALKAMKRVRASNAAAKASDRQQAVKA